MDFRKFLQKNIVLLDGATGTMLLKNGLKSGELPERMNITHSDIITKIHKEYFDAGSNVVCTNTFGANILKFSENELEEIVKNAVSNAKKARELSKGKQNKFIALDIGPTGKMLKPFGDLDFLDAIEVFKKTVLLGIKYGVDLVLIETMNDIYETKSAIIAVKECCDLPILVSNVFGKDGLMLSGTTPESSVCILEGLNVDGLGINCSLGPKDLFGVIDKMLEKSSTPILFKPNAGLPTVENNQTVYNVSKEEFADNVFEKVKQGVRIVGGCCGTTPEYIKELYLKIKGFKVKEITDKKITNVSSYSTAVQFDTPKIVGERINPTGKKRLKQAILEEDIGFILEEAIAQEKAGTHILDLNVGIPEKDEQETLVKFLKEIQSVVKTPIEIDTVNVNALEDSLRVYNGKALINSVNGKEESMNAVFPLAKKYGGVIVCLCLDENGIPDNALGRINIAKKIVNRAKQFGIKENDLIFDALTMTISSNKDNAIITLETLKQLNKLGLKTILGVSNVSFGLPNRDLLNSTFLVSCLNNGLSCAIMNPLSNEMMKAYYSFNATFGFDNNFENYISFTTGITQEKKDLDENLTLKQCIINGIKDKAKILTEKLLETNDALSIINSFVIPALDEVGKGYEEKKIYLPNLLMSAETAKVSFEVIKSKMVSNQQNRLKIVLATVKGDIHDLGKNIVKMMLENYGFCVIDLGKDVEPVLILKSVIDNNAKICGLSALMTTTVPYMKQTIELLKEKAPWCKTVVGGAVLTEEYAKMIGADKYSKDAMETVRFAEKVESDKKAKGEL